MSPGFFPFTSPHSCRQVLSCVGPAKPVRSAGGPRAASEERRPLVSSPVLPPAAVSPHRLQLETSFDSELPSQTAPLPPPAQFDDAVSVSTLQLVWSGRRPCPATPPLSWSAGRAAPLASPDVKRHADHEYA